VSRRNNLERTGAPQPDAPTPPTTEGSDLFAFVNPTVFVELPSKGRFYLENHPLNGEETIEIKHMTAKEEDILTSEALLKNELAIDRLLESVIINKNIKVGSLLLGDKNAILIASRITGFGPFYDVSTNCPSCYKKSDYTFNLEELKTQNIDELPEGVEHSGDGVFSFDLPTAKVKLFVKLLTSFDEKKLSKRLSSNTDKSSSTPVTDLLKSIIVGANEYTDKPTLHRFIGSLPIPDITYIRNLYDQIKPDVDLKFDFTCPLCDHEGKVVMPMTARFFWPNA